MVLAFVVSAFVGCAAIGYADDDATETETIGDSAQVEEPRPLLAYPITSGHMQDIWDTLARICEALGERGSEGADIWNEHERLLYLLGGIGSLIGDTDGVPLSVTTDGRSIIERANEAFAEWGGE